VSVTVTVTGGYARSRPRGATHERRRLLTTRG